MDAKILVKRLKVGDKVTIREDLGKFLEKDTTYCGVVDEMADLGGQEATITYVVSDITKEVQRFELNITDYSWNIEMFETINGEENPYKDLITDEGFEGYVPMQLFD